MSGQRSVSVLATVFAAAALATGASATSLNEFKQIVVIYEENHSFDNLYGLWGRAGGQFVDGLPNADLPHTPQVRQDNTAYQCLLQNDVNLTSPPLTPVCSGTNASGQPFSSAFKNNPFKIDDFIQPDDTTCPKPVGAF